MTMIPIMEFKKMFHKIAAKILQVIDSRNWNNEYIEFT